ncbi:hypothetical protein EYF80_002492 [Liparis tanakae]|uniref:Uncharacterized protein n=1 Tax=Liparis tanakae TaxID=230148 RepID=A0A4Z2JB07_9TELE|nr:hypothetical protein EYF80_002492 [Liparis tanakae]
MFMAGGQGSLVQSGWRGSWLSELVSSAERQAGTVMGIMTSPCHIGSHGGHTVTERGGPARPRGPRGHRSGTHSPTVGPPVFPAELQHSAERMK